MSDKATLRRLLRQISDAKRTEEIIIAEDAIVKLFDAVRDENFAETAALRAELDEANALVHEQDVIYMGHYRTVQEIRKATEELFAFIEAHADKKFLAHASALMDFRARIMPSNFPNSAALASHEARINAPKKGGEE